MLRIFHSRQMIQIWGQIKPAINPKGYRTSLKEYNEVSVIEEIAANSYDAIASTALFLLDELNFKLYIFDDGKGFNHTAMGEMLTIGGGKKESLYAEPGGRIYLGSYGFGFKAIVNIANEITVTTCSQEDNKKYSTTIDLAEFDKMMEGDSKGYDFDESDKPTADSKGTIIILTLKNPTDKSQLDEYIKVLGNLPNDNGEFNCYCGFISVAKNAVAPFQKNFTGLSEITKKLYAENKIQIVTNLFDSELSECEPIHVVDKENDASGIIYFAGMQGDKPKNLKESLRGVYGRLLKSDFSNDKYTAGISKYIQFKSSMRSELTIDWLRSEITLSRNSIKFNNPQLENLFKKTVGRLITQFINPQLAKLDKFKEKTGNKKFKQREELARKRVSKTAEVVIKGFNSGFIFKPDTDAELAILIAQDYVMKKSTPLIN